MCAMQVSKKIVQGMKPILINKLQLHINRIRKLLRQDSSYTVVLIPHDGKEIKKKSVQTSYFRKAVYTAGVAAIFFFGCLGAMCYVIYQGSVEQKELAEYRQTKQERDAKLKELTAMSENMQKEMSALSKLRNQVGEQMKQSGMNVEPNVTGDAGKINKYAGKGGPSAVPISNIAIILEQNKNLQENLQSEIKAWGTLLTNIKSENYRIAVTPNLWPVDGGYVSSEFGNRKDPFDNYSHDFHPGVDIAANYGAPVYASASGYVQQAGWNGGYGKYVRLSHDYGYGTAYGHLSGITVSGGDFVNKGDVIGYIGSTGYSTGPHLHFEVLLYGEPIDPQSLIK